MLIELRTNRAVFDNPSSPIDENRLWPQALLRVPYFGPGNCGRAVVEPTIQFRDEIRIVDETELRRYRVQEPSSEIKSLAFRKVERGLQNTVRS